MGVEFGVFDHIDRGGRELERLYDDRLRLVEAYERLGFHGYFVAEHHATPLGMAPSPGIFLSAVAQRTRSIRIGPLVYLLPLYNPLRLIWEICMLDQLSKGRFQLGIGRGISVLELGYHGVNSMHSRALFQETLDVVLLGLREKVLNYEGRHHVYSDVPMELEPVQKPHPPLWAGVNSPQSAAPAAKRGSNVVMNSPVAMSRKTIDAYIGTFRDTFGANAPLPKIGIARMIFIGETAEEAHAAAAKAYASFYQSACALYRRFATLPTIFPPEYEAIRSSGVMIAGSVEQVRLEVARQLRETNANYFAGRFAFGDLAQEQVLRSVELFAREVVPHCAEPAEAA
jgi:alkanesulfonate monooxygenase SsuD/methylene tetrahydromethanopterin reductase-like flavin-dependent oxidoreductase (luciferase family)